MDERKEEKVVMKKKKKKVTKEMTSRSIHFPVVSNRVQH